MKAHTVVLLSVCSVVLLIIASMFLIFIQPLEQNEFIHKLVSKVLSNDPKAQRDHVNVDLISTDVIFFLDQYINYLLISTGFAVLFNVFSLILLTRDRNLSGSLQICAAVATIFTIIPPILQMISGVYLLKKDR